MPNKGKQNQSKVTFSFDDPSSSSTDMIENLTKKVQGQNNKRDETSPSVPNPNPSTPKVRSRNNSSKSKSKTTFNVTEKGNDDLNDDLTISEAEIALREAKKREEEARELLEQAKKRKKEEKRRKREENPKVQYNFRPYKQDVEDFAKVCKFIEVESLNQSNTKVMIADSFHEIVKFYIDQKGIKEKL